MFLNQESDLGAMISKRAFLEAYIARLDVVLPDQIVPNSPVLQKKLLEALAPTLEEILTVVGPQVREKPTASQYNLKEILKSSKYLISGNVEGSRQGNIVKYPANAQESRNELEGLTTSMRMPIAVSGRMGVSDDVPVLIHGKARNEWYILFAYGTNALFDHRSGFGIGYNIVTDQQSYDTILGMVNANPKEIFRIFGTLSNDSRITRPKIPNELYIIPLENIRRQNYSSGIQKLSIWTGLNFLLQEDL